MNCKGVNGEPAVEGLDLTERGLRPDGVVNAKEGSSLGSGVRGGSKGVLVSSGVSSRVEELIHFSSRPLALPGDPSVIKRKLSAKWFRMNLREGLAQ